MIDQILLNDTLQKINASLNRRFEKNSDLYISKQDEYEIKKNLCNNAYGGLTDMAKAKGISNDIIIKVIIRNAGILDVKNVARFKKELKPVLENVDYSILGYMMEDIFRNNVYMQKEIKHLLFNEYMKGISDKARVDYWYNDEYTFDVTERAELFNSIILCSDSTDTKKSLKAKINFIKGAFKRYPELMQSDVYIKLKNTLDESGVKEFFNILRQEMISPCIDDNAYNFVLITAYASYGDCAFNDAVDQIKSSSPSNYKQYVKAIFRMLEKQKDKDALAGMFDTIYSAYDSPYMKRHIKREIDKKIWAKAKSNDDLYAVNKKLIDNILAQTEPTDKKEYASFSDVLNDLLAGEKPQNVGYTWINMKSSEFERSIMDSFTETSRLDHKEMSETYSSLFKHSLARGKIKELKKFCECTARILLQFDKSDDESEFFDLFDQIWLDNVLRYKLQSQSIKEYMCEKHFDRVKELE